MAKPDPRQPAQRTDHPPARTKRTTRRPVGSRKPDGRGNRPGILHISERPAEAADRAVPEHWEGDLVLVRYMSPVAALLPSDQEVLR
jgi:IS30 family transposase